MISLLPLFGRAQSVSEHTVASGETLLTIASKYGITVSELNSANSGLDQYVYVGMVLKIPTKQSDTVEVPDVPVDDLKDIIYLKDGSELVAKVLLVETDVVKFEQYDTDDPFSVPLNEVASIKFEDGRVSNFTTQPKKKTTNTQKSVR